jgi:cytochrome b561
MTHANYQREARPDGITEVASARSSEDSGQTFDPLMQTVHWITVVLILAVLATAALLDAVPTLWRVSVLQLHRSFGVTIWAVTVLRLMWRQFARLPEWPSEMTRAERAAARAVEYLLYGLLLLQPVLGFLHTNALGRGVTVFFLFRLPPLIGEDHDLADELLAAHAIVANILLIVIALHTAAALFHHFVRRDGVLRRMLPGTRHRGEGAAS